jgi:hypothetical protein
MLHEPVLSLSLYVLNGMAVFSLLCLKYACGFRDVRSAALITNDVLLALGSVLLRINVTLMALQMLKFLPSP